MCSHVRFDNYLCAIFDLWYNSYLNVSSRLSATPFKIRAYCANREKSIIGRSKKHTHTHTHTNIDISPRLDDWISNSFLSLEYWKWGILLHRKSTNPTNETLVTRNIPITREVCMREREDEPSAASISYPLLRLIWFPNRPQYCLLMIYKFYKKKNNRLDHQTTFLIYNVPSE